MKIYELFCKGKVYNIYKTKYVKQMTWSKNKFLSKHVYKKGGCKKGQI